MRYLTIAMVLFIMACKNESPQETLIGTWKLKDMANAGDSIVGTATFSKTNSLLLKTIINGKIADSTNCSYEFSDDNKYLTTKIDTSVYRFEILKLTKGSLELKEVENKKITRYSRLGN